MVINAIASLSTALSETQTTQAVQLTVLKEALDTQAQSAMQLLEAAGAASNPPHLGNNVDTYA